MKIGIDGRFLHHPESGHGTYSEELIKNIALVDKKNEYIIFINPLYKPTIDQKNFTFIPTDIKYYSILEQLGLHKLLNSYNLDLMHFVHFNKPILYRKTTVVTIHDLILNHFRNTHFFKQVIYKWLVKKTIRDAKNIIAVSKFTKDQIIKYYNVDPKKIIIAYEGYRSFFRPVSNKTLIKSVTSGYNITKPYIVYLGQQRSHKNLARLVKSFSLLRKRGLDCQLVFVGKKNPEYTEMINAIETSGFSKSIIFTGFVPEDKISVLISGAKLLVMPSLMEGFGLPVLEGLACGVPVASSNTSSLPEVGGKAAVYFNPENIEEMADVIYKAVTDKNLRCKLISNIDNQLKKFSWLKMAEQVKEIYEKR